MEAHTLSLRLQNTFLCSRIITQPSRLRSSYMHVPVRVQGQSGAVHKAQGPYILVSCARAESVQTINQLLTEMDGFDDNTGLIIMAATNRPAALDSALTRPGRFDRVIHLPLPNLQVRSPAARWVGAGFPCGKCPRKSPLRSGPIIAVHLMTSAEMRGC